MGLILSVPIKNVVNISKILAKTSVEDAETHPTAKKTDRCKRKTEPAKGSRRKDKKKKKSQAEGKNMGRKTVFWLGVSVFSCLEPLVRAVHSCPAACLTPLAAPACTILGKPAGCSPASCGCPYAVACDISTADAHSA
jgi:hypothetical protein